MLIKYQFRQLPTKPLDKNLNITYGNPQITLITIYKEKQPLIQTY